MDPNGAADVDHRNLFLRNHSADHSRAYLPKFSELIDGHEALGPLRAIGRITAQGVHLEVMGQPTANARRQGITLPFRRARPIIYPPNTDRRDDGRLGSGLQANGRGLRDQGVLRPDP